MRIRVALVDDDQRFLERTAKLLNGTRDLSCVGAYCDPEVALSELPKVEPDVVLMDLRMPRMAMNGAECAARLVEMKLNCQIVALTAFQTEQEIFETFIAGATGYLLKDTSPDDIVEAVRQVHQGGSPMTSQIARRIIRQFKILAKSTIAIEPLSQREDDVLRLAGQGFRDKEIAPHLGLSVHTVRGHFQRIYRKLNVNSRAQALAKFAGRAKRADLSG